MKKSLLCTLILGATTLCNAGAYDFAEGGVYYNKLSDTEVEVTYQHYEDWKYVSDYKGDIVIPSTVTHNDSTFRVTKIGNSAFSGCADVTSVTFPNSVVTTGMYAFSNCTGLKNVNFADSLELINTGCFNGCSSLATVTVPASVTNIGRYAFQDCKSLKEILVAEGNPVYTSQEGMLFRNDGQSLLECPAGKTGDVVINAPINDIWSNAFYNCTGITSITFGSQDVSFATSSFAGCTGLSEITIPATMQVIPEKAFYRCTGLKKVNFNQDLKRIDPSAFGYCTSLESITLPKELVRISEQAFSSCSSLKEINFNSGLMAIEKQAFSSCTSLTSVVVPDSVSTFEGWVFFDCTNLKSAKLGKMITTLPELTFGYCDNLATVKLGVRVAKIESQAFLGCDNLVNLYVGRKYPPFCSDGAFEGLNKQACTLYVQQGFEKYYQQNSNWKDFFAYKWWDPTSGVTGVASDALKVTAHNGVISISGTEAPVEVYSTSGALIYHGVASEVAVGQPGAYVVRVGGRALKVLL